MEVPEEINQQVLSDIRAFEQEKQMPFIDIAERVGIEKGMEKGMEIGQAKGMEIGQAKGLVQGIELLLKVKFGPIGPELMPEIRKVSGPERLQAIARSIESAATVDDVRQTLSA
jgi:hypothetical protein